MATREPFYFPVWPYYFLAALSFIAAGVILITWMPPWHPEKENLLRLEGAVETVEIRDDISNTTAGAIWPMLTSVYFTLEGHSGEFRYPYSHPDYFLVRDNTSGALEVWVNGSEIGTGVPMTIWQIQEHSSYNYLYPETSIKFETISALRDKVGTSWRRLAIWLLLAGGSLTAIGYLLRRWNQHRGARSQV